jgi:hypothetical protein
LEQNIEAKGVICLDCYTVLDNERSNYALTSGGGQAPISAQTVAQSGGLVKMETNFPQISKKDKLSVTSYFDYDKIYIKLIEYKYLKVMKTQSYQKTR